MLFLRTLLMFVFLSSLFACAPNQTVYNPILNKNIQTFGNINFPETIKKAYRNSTLKYKVLGDIKSGPYKGKINFGASNTSMNDAKLIFYTHIPCRNNVCIITHINDKKLKTLVDNIHNEIKTQGNKIKSEIVGETVLKHLKEINEVAYLRFASVYKEFSDASDFEKEVAEL